MKHEIPTRIIVTDPLPGVVMLVQRGKDELLPPSETSATSLVFDFPVTVDLSAAAPNFLGKYAQGPKDQRFVYVNSGTYAGQHSIWGRRAKISLVSITREQVEEAISTGARLEATIHGVGRDGGPVCASVKGVVWKVAEARA